MSTHTNETILANTIKDIKVKPNELYYHYREPNKYYRVLGIAINEANEKPAIIYRALYGEGLLWVRDYDIWRQEINHNGSVTTRFIKLGKINLMSKLIGLFCKNKFLFRG